MKVRWDGQAAVNMTFRYALVFSSLVLMDADSAGE